MVITLYEKSLQIYRYIYLFLLSHPFTICYKFTDDQDGESTYKILIYSKHGFIWE